MTIHREPKYIYGLTAWSEESRLLIFSSEENFDTISRELSEFGIVSRAENYIQHTPPVWQLEVSPGLDFDEVRSSI